VAFTALSNRVRIPFLDCSESFEETKMLSAEMSAHAVEPGVGTAFRPLTGITVVALEHAIAAPLATRHLADLGARVIKVERPGEGDFARGYDVRVRGLASHFVWTNRSKESVTLNLKHSGAQNILKLLILEKADVVVQNLAPGAAARLGIAWETLAPSKPSLILCDISGYGSYGPYRDRKAYDLLIQSEAGFLSTTGSAQAMAKAGISVADIAAGMYAYSSILAALIERGSTGRGKHIEISMLEAMAEWMGFPLYYSFEGAPSPQRSGSAHATIYPYGPFATGDGEFVMLAVQNEREWRAFCERVIRDPALGRDPRYATNTARSGNRVELERILVSVLSALSSAELIQRLELAQIANARVNEMSGLWQHPQLAARGRWRTVETPAGPVPALVHPGLIPADARMDAVPALGQHTASVILELGVSEAELAALYADEAI
jgi:itaconate CoA-transferase